MRAGATEYRSWRVGLRHGSERALRLDADGLSYTGPDQTLDVRWREVRALVAAAVRVGDDSVPALGLVLRMPFAQPTLVDGALPNLDYAIPIDDLGRRPLLGVSVSPMDIVNRAAELARPTGVVLLTAA